MSTWCAGCSDEGLLTDQDCPGPRVCPVGHRGGGWVIHCPLVVAPLFERTSCPSSPTRLSARDGPLCWSAFVFGASRPWRMGRPDAVVAFCLGRGFVGVRGRGALCRFAFSSGAAHFVPTR